VDEKGDKPKKTTFTKSCPVCDEPMTEKLTISGEKIIACEKYPHCYDPFDYYWDH